MAAVSIKWGYSAAKSIAYYAISSHVFEIFNIGGREVRIDAGRCAGTRSTFVGTISEGTKVHRTVIDHRVDNEKSFIRKLVRVTEEIIK